MPSEGVTAKHRIFGAEPDCDKIARQADRQIGIAPGSATKVDRTGMYSVYPSRGELAAMRAAMLPPAPG